MGGSKANLNTKYDICSFNGFGDILEGMPNILRVWSYEIRHTISSEILYIRPVRRAKAKLCAKFELSSFTGFGDILEVWQIFQGSRDLDHAPFQKFCTSGMWKGPSRSSVPNLRFLAVLVLEIYSRVCQIFYGSRVLSEISSCGKAKTKLCAKFELSSFTGFGDIGEGMPNFLGVT